jgi:hypothetical protein
LFDITLKIPPYKAVLKNEQYNGYINIEGRTGASNSSYHQLFSVITIDNLRQSPLVSSPIATATRFQKLAFSFLLKDTMASNSSSRERGTLLATLPRGWAILTVYFLVCTAFGTFLSQYSLHDIDYVDIGIGFKVSLGVASSMAALLYTDGFVFLLSYTASVSTFIPVTV